MAGTDKAVAVLKDNKVAVVVLIVGGTVFATYVANRAADVVDTTVEATAGIVQDIERKITGTGVLAAVILIGALALGVPIWAAWAATGLFLVTSGAGKLAKGILSRANGTGTGGLTDAELLRELCKAHGGAGSGILEVGGAKLGVCADETVIRLPAGN